MLGHDFTLVPRLAGLLEPVSPFPPLNSANGGADKTGPARGGRAAAAARGSRAGSASEPLGFPKRGKFSVVRFCGDLAGNGSVSPKGPVAAFSP